MVGIYPLMLLNEKEGASTFRTFRSSPYHRELPVVEHDRRETYRLWHK